MGVCVRHDQPPEQVIFFIQKGRIRGHIPLSLLDSFLRAKAPGVKKPK